jgi:hypothetical protein
MMTMREELIAAAKAAINRDEHNIGAQTFDEIHTRMATAAFIAIMDRLSRPSEAMLTLPRDDEPGASGAHIALGEDSYLSPRVVGLVWKHVLSAVGEV